MANSYPQSVFVSMCYVYKSEDKLSLNQLCLFQVLQHTRPQDIRYANVLPGANHGIQDADQQETR